MGPFASIGDVVTPHQVNGQPGAILRDRDDNTLSAMTLGICDGRIQAILTVSNPDRLSHVGPAGDAWTVVRALKGS